MQGYPQQQLHSPPYTSSVSGGVYGSHCTPSAPGGDSYCVGGTSSLIGGYNDQYAQQQQSVNHYNTNDAQWQHSYNSNSNQDCMAYENRSIGNSNGVCGEAPFLTPSRQNAATMVDGDTAMALKNDIPPAALNATDSNGLRWTWSTYPNTEKGVKQELAFTSSVTVPEMIIPLACLYTPLIPIEMKCLVIGDPAARGQQCPNCGAFWNKHCYREDGRFWVCLSCLRRNPTPTNYSTQHPALLYDTVEYIISPVGSITGESGAGEGGKNAMPTFPTFIFIIDTCLPAEELDALKKNIVRCLDWLPSQSLIGLISFGPRVSVWELGTGLMPRSYTIRGEKTYEPSELSTMLQLTDSTPAEGRFLLPLEDCEFSLTTLIEGLQCDDSVTPGNKRALRATGTAVAIAVRLLEDLQKSPNAMVSSGVAAPQIKRAGRLLLFTGGPCTRGPGTVVDVEKEKMMRFHRDIISGETPFYDAAFKFYNNLRQRLSDVHASLDVFAESFDQIGILEMRQAVNQTGGTFVCGDTFNHPMFVTSLQRYFGRCDLRICALDDNHNGTDNSGIGSGGMQDTALIVHSAFGVKFEVHTSADTLVCGVLGPCVVDDKANKSKLHRASSPIQVGVGGTTRWCVSTIDQTVTYTFVFDTATVNKKDGADGSSDKDVKRRFVQFVTRFNTPRGESRVRVTSIVLPIAPSSPRVNQEYFVRHKTFDQACAAAVLARMVVGILEKHPSKWDDTKRWLDTLLVRFVRRYGTFTPGIRDSLRLSPCLSLFPSFIFNLRRSEYFMVLNISPDETTFKRHWLMRESVENCVLMMQPTLHSYEIEAPTAAPVPLDSCSLRQDNILLMDAFFNIHIMWGTTIYAWIQAKYHENPEYVHFAQLLDTVEADATALLGARYPYPRFSRTDANGSEARHIKTRMNPATTHHSGAAISSATTASSTGDQSDVIYTDEASIVKFMESLKQAVVSTGSESGG